MPAPIHADANAGAASAGEEETPLYKDPNLLILFGVTLMVVMGVTSIAPTFPNLIKHLDGVHEGNIGLIVTLFTVPGIILTPLMGILADRVGRKAVLVPSLVIFSLAGTACAFAPGFKEILVLRFIQGVGAAALGALNVTIIGDLYTGTRRAGALGLNAGVLSMGIAAYPVLGGALGYVNWRLPFALPLLALPLAAVVWLKLHNPEPDTSGGLKDYFKGAWQGLRQREVAGLFAATLAAFIMLYGAFLTYLPVQLGRSFHASPLIIGSVMSLSAFATGLAAAFLGKLTTFISDRLLLFTAFILYGASCVSMALMPGIWWHLLPVALFGLGQGINMPCVQALLANLAPMKHRGGFMALNGMVLRMGQTIGPFMMGLLYGMGGLEAVFISCAVIGVITAFALLVLMRPRTQDRQSG